MSVLHIQGLCLAVWRPDVVSVYLLNSAVRPSPLVPYHLPSLFASRSSILVPTVPPLPSIAGRWDSAFTDDGYVGWDLHGTTVVLDGQAQGPEIAKSHFSDVDLHPTVVAGSDIDWSDIKWVLDATKLLPGATPKPSFTRLGPNVNAVVHVRGGRLLGGDPLNAAGARFVWTLTPTYRQAYTDTLDIVFDEGQEPTIELFDPHHKSLGTIPWTSDGEAWLVNEMTQSDAEAYLINLKKLAHYAEALGENEPAAADANDLEMYLDAFEFLNPEGKPDQPAMAALRANVTPRRAANPFSNDLNAYDVPTCGTLLFQWRK